MNQIVCPCGHVFTEIALSVRATRVYKVYPDGILVPVEGAQLQPKWSKQEIHGQDVYVPCPECKGTVVVRVRSSAHRVHATSVLGYTEPWSETE